MNTKADNKRINKKLLLIIAAVVLVAVLIVGGVFIAISNNNKPPSFKGSELNISKFTPVEIYDGLQITSLGDYSGLFLEDGSDEVVASIMMMVLENTSDKDLQLARVKVMYPDFTAEFEATNLPAGESLVLLEKKRHQSVDVGYSEIKAENVAFFSENMSLMEDTFKVSAGDGYVEVENISGKDIKGVTYIYYKNVAGETLYGGITYRAKIEETIPSGGSVRVLTNHITENNSEILQIVNVK